jgi:hypothetical protein
VIFIDEFVAELHRQLHEERRCLTCEKRFQTYDQLRLHMRKKRHLDISGRSDFDRFYLSNYLGREKSGGESGEDDEEDEEEGGKKQEETWEGWMDESGSGTVCLFCPLRLPSSSQCLDHMRLKHDFDLVALVQEKHLDFFARVRLVNYMRRNGAAAGKDWKSLDFDYSDVQLLFPALEDDELLQHEFDHVEGSQEAERLAGARRNFEILVLF